MASSHRYMDSLEMLDAMEKGGTATHAGFAEQVVRNGFMKKVFGLLAFQLAITTVIGAVCVLNTNVTTFLLSTPIIPTLAFFATMAIIITFSVSEAARSSHPTNLILLTVFTVCEGVLVGMACGRYPADLVLTAFVMTAAVSSGLAVYALRTKSDWTNMGACLHAMLMAFIMAIFMQLFFHVPIISLGLSLCGAALFSAYLVYDIQLLMGGNHAHKLSPDEYVMATISIYLDIVNLFLYILRVLSEMRRD